MMPVVSSFYGWCRGNSRFPYTRRSRACRAGDAGSSSLTGTGPTFPAAVLQACSLTSRTTGVIGLPQGTSPVSRPIRQTVPPASVSGLSRR